MKISPRTPWNRGFPGRQNALELGLSLRQNALDPGFHCVRTHWIRGFMALQLVRRTRTVVLMVPV
jgi:hypothetical protein